MLAKPGEMLQWFGPSAFMGNAAASIKELRRTEAERRRLAAVRAIDVAKARTASMSEKAGQVKNRIRWP